MDMPYDELLGWMNYFERRPVGWRDDDRTFKLMQVQGCEQKAGEIFPALQTIYAPAELKPGQMDMGKFKGSVMFQKLALAKGGDKLEF